MSFAPMLDTVVTADAAYPVDPQFIVPFEPSEYFLQNISADVLSTVQISFDGVTTHYEMVKSTPSESLKIHVRSRKVWFRRGVVGAGAITARASASAE